MMSIARKESTVSARLSNEIFMKDVAKIVRNKTGLVLAEKELEKLRKNVFQNILPEAREGFLQDLNLGGHDNQNLLTTLDAMVNNETFFFRHKEQFTFFEEVILKEIWCNIPKYGLKRIRMMSAGCSVGAEAYSMLISAIRFLAAELGVDYRQMVQQYDRYDNHFDAVNAIPHVLNFFAHLIVNGFDISLINVCLAQKGVFPMLKNDGIRGNFEDRDIFFSQPSDGRSPAPHDEILSDYHVHQLLKNCVNFRRTNLRSFDNRYMRYDVIFCRNVLMYNSQESRVQIVRHLLKSLGGGGYIVFAPTDFPPNFVRDELEYCGQQIFRKNRT